jgi:hypothetical protein
MLTFKVIRWFCWWLTAGYNNTCNIYIEPLQTVTRRRFLNFETLVGKFFVAHVGAPPPLLDHGSPHAAVLQ